MPRTRAPISPEVKTEAAAWLSRLHSDSRAAADDRAFQAWLAAKPEHAAAFEVLTTVWEAAGGVSRSHREDHGRVLVSRRTVVAGVGALVAAGASVSVWRSVHAGVYETGVGEQKHVTLSDGTQAFLDTDTRIRERFDDRIRKVDLDRGRVNFHVASDPVRPFIVDAAGQRIAADGTNMDVRRDDTAVSVLLLQGQATVSSGAASGSALAAGERLVAGQGNTHVDRPNPAPLVAWQTGQAMFDNETLADAIREMNRYSTVTLTIGDPAIARLRLSGVYRVGDNQAFARSVATLLPVKVRSFVDRIEFLPDAGRTPAG